jgi:hypothetical protein
MKNCILLLIFCAKAWSQDARTEHLAEAPKPLRALRILPLGEDPRPLHADGTEDLLLRGPEFSPGSFLPSKPVIRIGDHQEAIKLCLGVITHPIQLSEGSSQIEIRQKNTPKPWIKFQVPDAGDSLGLLYQNHQKMDWQSPQVLLLRDDAKAFPPSHIRFVNTSDTLAIVKIGESKRSLGLLPGKTLTKPLNRESDTFEIWVKEPSGALRTILKHKVTLGEGRRGQALIYKARNLENKEPVLVKCMTEKAPQQ